MTVLSSAAELPLIPVSGVKYGPAAASAQEAFLSQSGIDNDARKVKAYGEATSERYLAGAGLTVPAAVIGFGYRAYRDKSVNIPVSSSFRISVFENKLGININF